MSKKKKGKGKDGGQAGGADSAQVATEAAPAPAPAGDAAGGAPGASAPAVPFALKAVVFTCGAGIMALEITGSRLLAPHFGNSVYVWSSLIGLFMGALATGYWGGGSLADRFPSFLLLGAIVVAGALTILMLPLLASPICIALEGAGLGERWGPLIASLCLFFVPSVLLGAVSPFSVRLATRDIAGVGRIAGRLYALSTFGSIFGTLFTAFVLIPSVGVHSILKILGVTLLIAPIIAVLLMGKQLGGGRRSVEPTTLAAIGGAILAGLGFAAVPPSPVSALAEGQQKVFETDSAYHHIVVIEEAGLEARRRYLHFDNYRESGIHLIPPYETACEYTEMFDLAWLFGDHFERALFIGGGGGLGPRTFHRRYPQMTKLHLVEIDPAVLEIAREQFYYEDVGPIESFVGDGRMFVRAADPKSYDVIFLDAFTIGGRIPPHLVTKEFFEEIASRLSDDGIILCNLNSAVTGPKAKIFEAVVKTLREVFDGVHSFPKPDFWRKPDHTRNIIVIGTKKDPFGGLPGAAAVREKLVARAAALVERWDDPLHDEDGGSDLDGFARRCLTTRLDRFVEFTAAYDRYKIGDGDDDWAEVEPLDLEHVPVLTDDYAPIEDMAF